MAQLGSAGTAPGSVSLLSTDDRVSKVASQSLPKPLLARRCALVWHRKGRRSVASLAAPRVLLGRRFAERRRFVCDDQRRTERFDIHPSGGQGEGLAAGRRHAPQESGRYLRIRARGRDQIAEAGGQVAVNCRVDPSSTSLQSRLAFRREHPIGGCKVGGISRGSVQTHTFDASALERTVDFTQFECRYGFCKVMECCVCSIAVLPGACLSLEWHAHSIWRLSHVQNKQ